MGTRVPLGQYAALDDYAANWDGKDDSAFPSEAALSPAAASSFPAGGVSEISSSVPLSPQPVTWKSIAAPSMAHTSMSIGEVAEKAGFFDAAHFSRVFKEKYGCTPIDYRKAKA